MGNTCRRYCYSHDVRWNYDTARMRARLRSSFEVRRTGGALRVWPAVGSPLVLSRVHWVEPKLVAEIAYLTWTADGLLRSTVYVGLREDKPAEQVRRER
jgi:ATP-dependent DNA ligase